MSLIIGQINTKPDANAGVLLTLRQMFAKSLTNSEFLVFKNDVVAL